MIGLVGKLKIHYYWKNENFEEIINISCIKEFCLKQIPDLQFKILEIGYIEDTIYGVLVGWGKDDEFDIWISGNEKVRFEIQDIKGTMELSYI